MSLVVEVLQSGLPFVRGRHFARPHDPVLASVLMVAEGHGVPDLQAARDSGDADP
jgi:hypothetical protein